MAHVLVVGIGPLWVGRCTVYQAGSGGESMEASVVSMFYFGGSENTSIEVEFTPMGVKYRSEGSVHGNSHGYLHGSKLKRCLVW